MYHINNNQEAKPCHAKTPEGCRFFVKDSENGEHYYNLPDAQKRSEELLQKEADVHENAVRYSFMKEFKKQEEKFQEDFDGFPKRFFNVDLLEKYNSAKTPEGQTPEDYIEEFGDRRVFLEQPAAARLFSVCSSPSDAKASDDEVMQSLKNLGAEDVQPIHDADTLRSLGAERAFYAVADGQQVAVLGKGRGTNFASYNFRFGIKPPFETGSFLMTDVRTVMGAERAERKTGISAFFAAARARRGKDKAIEARNAVIRMGYGLQEAQYEGKNFQQQKQHVRDSKSTIATAMTDKKNPDKTRQEMMKNTRLNGSFKKVEIDNDVDPAEYADFENAYEEAAAKLPPIPGDRTPNLRIRKLGKHRATGLYSPAHNTIAIDVRDSSAFVHEYGHALDLTVKNNASLGAEFRGMVADYSKELQVPDGEPESRRAYLTTPTEVFARMFESYGSEKLGISNRLIDSNKFRGYDYQPFMNNEKLKQKAFAFFDKLFAEK